MFSFNYNNIDFSHKLDKPSSPSEEYFKHIHCFNEILFLVHGDVDYTVESETQHLSEGDIVFIPSGKYHFATVNHGVPYERYVLKFPDRFVPEHVREKLSSSANFFKSGKKFEMNFHLLDEYAQHYAEEELYTLFVSEIIKFMVLLYHEPAQPVKKHDDFIVQLIEYIDANLHKPITIQTLIDEFHYSKSFINLEFKRRMQIPVMQYIRTKKVMVAHQLILSGAKKSSVAGQFGFETYSTFYRAYKKLLKELPNGLGQSAD